MRLTSLVALAVVVAGCNQLFGHEPVRVLELDAPDATLDRVAITFQQATTSGPTPDLALAFPEIPDLAVRVGAPGGELAPAAYTGGELEIPLELAGATWRLEYAVAAGAVHELQWSPGVGRGRVRVPLFGPLERVPPPTGAGWIVTPVGAAAPNPFRNPRVFTTGIWTVLTGTIAGRTATFGLDVAGSPVRPESGEPGTPTGDAIVVDYATESAGDSCTFSNGTAEFAVGTLAVTKAAVAPAWSISTNVATSIAYVNAGVGDLEQRMATSLGSRSGIARRAASHGYTPHEDMPMLTRRVGNVPQPLLVPAVTCPAHTTATKPYKPMAGLVAFPRLASASIIDARMLGALALDSSIVVGQVLPPEPSEALIGFRLDFAVVPLAIAPILLDGQDLAGGADDSVAIAAGPGAVPLAFALESIGRADHVEVTLFRLGATLEPIRIYLAAPIAADPAPKLQLDRALLESGRSYILAIRTVRGVPDAPAGDFTRAEPVQAIGTIFTRSFRVP